MCLMINICDHLFLAEQTRTEAHNDNMIKFINIIMVSKLSLMIVMVVVIINT